MLQSICRTVLGAAYGHALLFLLLSPPVGATICPNYGSLQTELGERLSRGSSIDKTTIHAPRWSEYAAPDPRFVINVASESDVAITVRSI